MKKFDSGFLRPVDIAIQLTVSILSPVSIQIWIFEFFKLSIVSAQFSYN